uniref:Plasminogen activator inhibitor 1 RNA-binding protein n=1 Tax=Schistosoma japonicum TaxID=6182 RepID=C1L9Z7_SCHJA|nr:Plasminogen activator inhibitor 1 RNA-binding protein [Schistosoma japonicum]CAX77347.1 Plasminogen activator inhibitor 1 RNA-binding protein [Schistosoma japonicum]
MAGVDHAYQYSVEVKSRFSLFLDDALNSEDPDILLSKLKSRRAEKTKKDKPHVQQQAPPVKVDTTTKSAVKVETTIPKAVSRVSRSPNANEPPPVVFEDVQITSAKETDESASPFVRGRGLGRGLPRGMRGGRGQGPRMTTEAPLELASDLNASRAPNFEPRGRGRGRGRGMPGRGRGMPFNSNRDFDNQSGSDRQGIRQHGRREGNWEPQDVDGQVVPENGDSRQNIRSDNRDEVDDRSESVQVGVEEGADTNTETPVEEEPKSYTLEEYKAVRQSSKPAVLLSNKSLRKANDGKDVFANMVAHRKIQEIHEDIYEVEEKENEPEVEQSIDIDFSFADEFGGRRRGGRGYEDRGTDRARGGLRGAGSRNERLGRGRGQSRSEGRGRGFGRVLPVDEYIPPPAIHSDQEFPSLK